MKSLQHIQDTLQSPDEESRRKVIQDLKLWPLCQTSSLLFCAMGDESWRVRKEAVEAFVSSGPDDSMINSLLELLRNEENAGLRNSAAEAASRLGERAADQLIRLASDADADVRKLVLDIMGAVHSSRFLPTLLTALQDDDVNVAAAAAEHLGNLGDARAVPYLFDSTVSNDADQFRFNALAALGKLAVPAPVSEEIRRLADKDLLRKAVYECLGSIADESADSMLLDGTGVRQKSSRNAALIALFRIYSRSKADARQAIESALRCMKGSDRVPLLLDSFDPGEPLLSEALVVLLDIIGDKRSVDVFLRAFSSERLSTVALKALKHLGPDGIELLISRFSGSDDTARAAICTLIGECAYRNGGKIICEALNDVSPVVRKAAVSAAARLGLTECIPGIVRLIDDSDQDVRNNVVVCLQGLALIDCSAIQAVAQQLGESEHPAQRRNAAVLFAALGDSDRLSLLIKDEDAMVRQAAVASVGKLRVASSGSILTIALVDEDPDVRIAAATALGQIGGDGVITALTHALSDDDIWVRCAVLNSLARVYPEGTINAVATVFPAAEGMLLITCLRLLEGQEDRQALELVEKCLDSSDEEVVILALAIIGRRAPERIAAHAERLLSHEYWDVRVACARTVALLPNDQARRLLEQALEHERNDLVRSQMLGLVKGFA